MDQQSPRCIDTVFHCNSYNIVTRGSWDIYLAHVTWLYFFWISVSLWKKLSYLNLSHYFNIVYFRIWKTKLSVVLILKQCNGYPFYFMVRAFFPNTHSWHFYHYLFFFILSLSLNHSYGSNLIHLEVKISLDFPLEIYTKG